MSEGLTAASPAAVSSADALASDAQPTPPRRAWSGRDWLIVVLSLLPIILGFVLRIGKAGHWFNDYEAVACAAQRFGQGLPYYDKQLACTMMNPTVFIYPPWVAAIFAALERISSFTFTTALYGGAYLASVVFLIRKALVGDTVQAPVSQRAPFLAFVAGSGLRYGNIALPVHGAVIATAAMLPAADLLLAGVIGLCGAIKPIFLTYAVIFMLADRPLWRRGLGVVIAGLIAALPLALFYLLARPLFEVWRSFVSYFVLTDIPGVGFFAWLSWTRIDLTSLWSFAVYVPYAAAMIGAGLAIAELNQLKASDRLWLGVSLAALLNPRLMTQDLLVLGPGVLVAIKAAGPRWSARCMTLAFVVCALTGLATIAGGRVGAQAATLVLAVMVLAIGWSRVVRRGAVQPAIQAP